MQQLPFNVQHVPNRNISPDLLRLIGCNMRGMLMLMTSTASAEASITALALQKIMMVHSKIYMSLS